MNTSKNYISFQTPDRMMCCILRFLFNIWSLFVLSLFSLAWFISKLDCCVAVRWCKTHNVFAMCPYFAKKKNKQKKIEIKFDSPTKFECFNSLIHDNGLPTFCLNFSIQCKYIFLFLSYFNTSGVVNNWVAFLFLDFLLQKKAYLSNTHYPNYDFRKEAKKRIQSY